MALFRPLLRFYGGRAPPAPPLPTPLGQNQYDPIWLYATNYIANYIAR